MIRKIRIRSRFLVSTAKYLFLLLYWHNIINYIVMFTFNYGK